MKKLFVKLSAIIIAATLLIGLSAGMQQSSAATVVKAAIEVENTTVNQGETVDIPVNIVNNPGVIGFDLKITYPESFVLNEVKKGNLLTAAEQNSVLEPDDIEVYTPGVKKGYSLIGYAGEDNAEGDGTLFILSFTAAADSEIGAQNITINPGTATSSPGGIYTVNESNDDIETIDMEKDSSGNLASGVCNVEEAEKGHVITIKDYTRGIKGLTDGDKVSDIDLAKTYNGETSFNVTFDTACFVAIENSANSYTKLICEEQQGNHTFTVDVTDDMTIVIVRAGDADLNGALNTKDATVITKFVQDNYNMDALQELAADADSSGGVKTKDASKIIKIVSGTDSASWK